MPAFEAVPVMLPKDKEEWTRLDLLNLLTGGGYGPGVAAAHAFEHHQFPPDYIPELAIDNLNIAMARVRSDDFPQLERR